MQTRDIVKCIVFSIITCGIYGIIWFINITDDINQLDENRTTSGVMSFLLTLITCGVYKLYWGYIIGESIDKLKQERGINSQNTGILYLILLLIPSVGSIVVKAIIQNELNKYIQNS